MNRRQIRAVAAFILVLAGWGVAHGQAKRRASGAERSFTGWRPVSESTNQQFEVRYYQAQGSLSDADALPQLPSLPGTASPSAADLPPTLPPIDLPHGPVDGSIRSNPLRNGTANWSHGGSGPQAVPRAVLPESSSDTGRSGVATTIRSAPNPVPSESTASQVRALEAGSQSPSHVRATTVATSTRPVGSSTASGRLSPAATQSSSPGRLDPRSIATGLPYVTPPPGRYPTSPINPMQFRTASYQQPVLPSGQATNGQAGGQASQPASTLPQYAQPGIYATAYPCSTGTVPTPSVPSTGATPGTFVPPTLTPNWYPNLYSPNNAGFRPLITLGQENYNVVLGRGIIGQPTVYVPGQPFRNFLRYISP